VSERVVASGAYGLPDNSKITAAEAAPKTTSKANDRGQ
jgi:hypothetical protein